MSETPDLPPGQTVALPGRGETFVRTIEGPPGAPTVLLLHGWFVNADLNWFHTYAPLGEHYNVVALDHRGHGRGIRSRERFRFSDVADDAAALLDVLGIATCIPVGYSLGGPVAMTMWHRHPHRIDGLVLCATASRFNITAIERAEFPLLAPLAQTARVIPARLRQPVFKHLVEWRIGTTKFSPWMREQILQGDPRLLLQAGRELGRFNAQGWIGEVDDELPLSVLVVTDDTMVPAERQWALANSMPHAKVFTTTGTHDAPVLHPKRFVAPFLESVHHAAGRS